MNCGGDHEHMEAWCSFHTAAGRSIIKVMSRVDAGKLSIATWWWFQCLSDEDLCDLVYAGPQPPRRLASSSFVGRPERLLEFSTKAHSGDKNHTECRMEVSPPFKTAAGEPADCEVNLLQLPAGFCDAKRWSMDCSR
jgi:hypothetical protein